MSSCTVIILVRKTATNLGAASLFGMCISLVYLFADSHELRRQAQSIVSNAQLPSAQVEALNSWVFRHLGFSENPGYFILPSLRAAPIQVLRNGGDCADKSRLLVAMLKQVDIPSTMLMCFDPQTGRPTHTVVEAVVENGERMVVDPVYELSFPRPGTNGYFGLLDIQARPSIVQERVQWVQMGAAAMHPIRRYDVRKNNYAMASTVNWQRDRITQIAGDCMTTLLGQSAFRLPRPAILEEPQMAVAGICAALSVLLVCVQLATGPRRSTAIQRRSRLASPPCGR